MFFRLERLLEEKVKAVPAHLLWSNIADGILLKVDGDFGYVFQCFKEDTSDCASPSPKALLLLYDL